MEKGQNAVTYVARSHPVWHVLLTWEIYVCFKMNLYNNTGNYWLLTVAIQKVVWLGVFLPIYPKSTCKPLQIFEGMGVLEEKNHITHVER